MKVVKEKYRQGNLLKKIFIPVLEAIPFQINMYVGQSKSSRISFV